jgi:hypothetical protein
LALQTLQEKAPELVERMNKNVGFGMGLEFREGEHTATAAATQALHFLEAGPAHQQAMQHRMLFCRSASHDTCETSNGTSSQVVCIACMQRMLRATSS